MMESANIILVIIYSLVCVAVIVLVVKLASKKSGPPLKKAPASYVSISPADDVESFMDVYNLDWKPSQQRPEELPDDINTKQPVQKSSSSPP